MRVRRVASGRKHARLIRLVQVGLLSVIAALIPLVALGLLAISLSQQAIRNEVEAKLRLTTALSGSFVSEHFGSLTAVVDSRVKIDGLVRAVADGDPENFDEAEINRQLQALYESRSDLTGVSLMDLGGVLRASVTSPDLIGRDFSERGYFKGVVATGEPYVSGAFASAATGPTRYVVSIAAYVRAPSVDGGAPGPPLAVMVASIGLDDIQAVADDLARAQGVGLWVTDQNGAVVAEPGGLPVGLQSASDAEIGAATSLPPGELGVIGSGTGEALVVREVAGPPGWALFATIGLDEAYAGADKIRVAVLAIGLPLALVVCVGIVVLLMMQRQQWDSEAHLAIARDEAREANRRKSNFLANMSHELRTPLNSILGFGRLLEIDKVTAEQRINIGFIIKSGEHLLGLIDEVLDISKMERGQIRLTMGPVSAREVVQEAIGMCRPLADRREIFIVDETVSSQAYIHADRQRVKQVLVNLVANAVKYNRDGGEIRVTLTSGRTGTVRLSVVDTGIGIAKDDLGRLFQPFERLSAEGTSVEGTGLGLALTKNLVVAMDGEVGVSSKVGEGSTFWIELPAATPPAHSGGTETTRGSGSVAPLAGKSFALLYIEDNLTNVRLLEQVMRLRPNVDLMVAMQGRIGLQMALDHRPAVVLLDLHLPDIPGQEVLRQLRADERTAATPVVILSADATTDRAGDPDPAGVTTFLNKPFDIARLLQLIDELGDSPDKPVAGQLVERAPTPMVAADPVTLDDSPDDTSAAIADFAHELINMLGVVVTYCDLMAIGTPDPLTITYLDRAGDAAELAVTLTRNFVLMHSVGQPLSNGRIVEHPALVSDP